MPGWIKHKLKSKLLGEILMTLRHADDNTLMVESKEELKSLLTKVKEESEKLVYSSTFKKLRLWHLVSHFMANRWERSGN